MALAQGLQESGWTIGGNVRIDTRWGAGNAERYRRYAAELVALAPDVILVNGPAALAQLQQATRSVPIVFVNVVDPVGAGFVVSVARPGGNATGFMLSEYSTSGKWLELLKEIAPRVTRAAIIRDPTLTAAVAQFAAIQSAAASLGVELSPIDIRNTGEVGADHRRVRAPPQWRPDRDGGGRIEHSSQPDHHAGGAAPAASSVPVPLLRRRRRPDLLRA